MLDTVFGVPAHALIVHATVVLLPLAALCAVAVALVPALRRRYGLAVGLLTVAAVASVPAATSSGEHLFARQSARFGPGDVAEAGLMQRHSELAEQLLPVALLLLLGVLLVLVPPLVRDRMAAPVGTGALTGALTGAPAGATAGPTAAAPAGAPVEQPAGSSLAATTPGWVRAVAALGALVTVVGAVLTLVLVVRIGHAGSEAAWERLHQPSRSLSR